jgi:outer membrane protein
MKTQKTLILLLFTVLSTGLFAQKFGHLNSNELLMAMPERATIEEEIKNHAKTLEARMMGMQKELETKYQNFQANEATMSDAIKELEYKELTDLDQRIKDFQATAQEDLARKEKKLTDPLIQKVKKAIEEVAKENNFTYIFDNSAGFLLYTGGGEDVTALVKKKLGLVE